MERKYYRTYESIIPKEGEFSVIDFTTNDEKVHEDKPAVVQAVKSSDFQNDDVLLLALLVLLLSEENKDTAMILAICYLFISKYIF